MSLQYGKPSVPSIQLVFVEHASAGAWVLLQKANDSFQRVLPYFRKMETDVDFHDDYHGTDGPIFVHHAKSADWNPTQVAFYNACRAKGFPDCPDHNHPDATGVGPAITNNHNRVRFSTALGYLSQGRHRLNLTIRPDCAALRILFDGQQARAVIVESGGETFTVEGEEIILCAGAIGSPQLLMLSGVGPAADLQGLGIPVVQDLPGVGQNLRDHPKVYLTWQVKDDYPEHPGPARGGVSLRITSPGSNLQNDMSLGMSSFVTERVNPWDSLRLDRDGEGLDARRKEMMVAQLLPKSSGELLLTSTDPGVQPRLDYNYLAEPFDRERLRAGVRLALELAEHHEIADSLGDRISPTDADLGSDQSLDDWLLREVTTFSHISGTCKMGPASDPMAVVDQYGKVHGLACLRVVDASIMPNLVRAPINPAVLMIGERIADLMRQ